MVHSNGAITSKTILKARLADDIRKSSLHHANDLTLIDLVSNVQRIFSLPSDANFWLKYKDQDGDLVSLTSDSDLLLALTTVGATLDITVVIDSRAHDLESSSDDSSDDEKERDSFIDDSSDDEKETESSSDDSSDDEKETESSSDDSSDDEKETESSSDDSSDDEKETESSSDNSSDNEIKPAAKPTSKATPVAAKKRAESSWMNDLHASAVLYNEISDRKPELVSKMFDEATRGVLDSFLKENETPKLEDIVNGNVFKKRKSTASTAGSEPPSKKVTVKESSSSDSSDDEAVENTGTQKPVNVAAKKAAIKSQNKQSSSSSASDSDTPAKKLTPAKKPAQTPAQKKAASSSDSDSDDEGPKKVHVIAQKAASGKRPAPVAKKENKKGKTKDSNIDSEDSENGGKKANPVKVVPIVIKPIVSKKKTESSSDDLSDDEKKPAATTEKPVYESRKRKSSPFRSVQLTKDSVAEKFRNNHYNSSFDQWGHRANEHLSKVGGKGLSYEKTKKKKGSYGGGPIDQSVRSIKFLDSE